MRMAKRTWTRWSAAFLGLALLVPAAGAAPAAAQEDGGTLIAAWTGPCCNGVDWVTPWDGGGDAHFFNKIYSRLTTYQVDPETQGYGPLIGDLADSWEISEDQLTWTFHLHPGVTWHDGTPFTANDVAFSFDLAMNPKKNMTAVYGAPLQTVSGAKAVLDGTADHISGVKVIDDNTISVTFDAPNALFPDSISELFILPQHTVGALDVATLKENEYWKTSQIGTGPFKWTKYTPGESIELTAYENYFKGAPKLAGLIRRQVDDPAAGLLAFDNGELDFTYLTADEVAREKDNPNATVFPGPSGVDNVIQCNPITVTACANNDFRHALLASIDRQTIIDNLYGPGGAEIVPCLYGRPNLQGDVQPEAFDPAKAQELLKSSGVDVASLGELTFDTYYTDALSLNVMTAIAQNWKDTLGLNVKIEQMKEGWTTKYYDEGKSQLSFFGAANGPTGERARNYFYSASAYPQGNNGWTSKDPAGAWHYDNPEMDKLLDTGPTLFDQAAQDANYAAACQIMADDLPWLYLWQTVRYHVVSNKLANVILIPAAGGGSYYDAVETWTKSE